MRPVLIHPLLCGRPVPTIELEFEVDLGEPMKWGCQDCAQKFLGPSEIRRRQFCPHCGSPRVIDYNISRVTVQDLATLKDARKEPWSGPANFGGTK